MFRDGITPLVDDVKISGATSAMLTIADVLGGDGGSYRLQASNRWLRNDHAAGAVS